METLTAWALRERVEAGAVLAGLGMVRDTEIGYLRHGGYQKATFEEPLELLGLAGSIAWEEDAPSLHLHLIGGRPDHTTVGGHLFRATVAVLAEIRADAFPGRRFRRPSVPSEGIRALDLYVDRPAEHGPTA